MRVVITKASSWAPRKEDEFREFREIETLDQLRDLLGEFGHQIIVSSDLDGEAELELQIYDDYVE